MGFRTGQMHRTAERLSEPEIPPEVHHGLINGRSWRFQPGDDQCDDCYTLETRAGSKRPPEAHSCITVRAKMVCFIFLAVAIAAFINWWKPILAFVLSCVVAGVLPLDWLVCAAGIV